MTISTWSPGTVYLPGSLVFPRTVPGAAATSITNADFESGDTDWTKGTGWAINTNLAFAGTYSAEFTGTGTDPLIHSTKHAISPGKAITANCFVHQGAAADEIASAAVTLTWYTSADAVISTSSGNVVQTGAVGVWFKSTVSATAPATAAKVSIGCLATSDGTALNVDEFSWNYVTGAAATGLAYKALGEAPDAVYGPATDVTFSAGPLLFGTINISGGDFVAQGFTAGGTITISGSVSNDTSHVIAAVTSTKILIIGTVVDEAAGASVTITQAAADFEAGTSGAEEPDWPTTVGETVQDNDITWEAISTGSVTWEASSVLTSGTTEPTWPTVTGAFVSDNNIAWETVPLRITDENCPHSRVVAIAASKVFAGDTDVVRFCTTLNARDWSTEEDAGFIPSGLQQKSQVGVEAMGVYRGNLAIWSGSTFQVWQVDPDPAAMNLLDAMEGVGSMFHQAVQPVSDDLFFLAALGVRTVAIAAGTNNLATGDVGKPIDVLVKPEADEVDVEPIATYYPAAGQYWLAFRPATDAAGAGGGGGNGGNGGGAAFVNYEYLMFATDSGYLVRYIGLDYVNNEYTDFGSYYEVLPSLISDGDTLISARTSGVFNQYHWRGTCFTNTYSEDLGYTNNTQFMSLLQGLSDQFVAVGVNASGRGIAVVDYEPSREETLDFASAYTSVPETLTGWYGAFDLRFGNAGTAQLGDALFLQGPGAGGAKLYTYKQSGGTLVVADASSFTPNTLPSSWGVDRDDGWAAYRSTGNVTFVLYQVDMSDLSISSVGTVGDADDEIYSILPVPGTDGDMWLTYEHTGGASDYFRTYSRTGLVLSKLDEVLVGVRGNSNTRFWVSPFSNRIWHQGIGGVISELIQVDEYGTITIPFSLPHGSGSSGYTGSFMAFLGSGLTTWDNGYTGIKQKLYQCWELDESGNDNRTYAFTDSTASQIEMVAGGSMSNVASDVGNAAVFDGASVLISETVAPAEMGTSGTFSMCIDVRLDSPGATDQFILVRARSNWTPASPETEDFGLYYVGSTGKFAFFTRTGTTVYSVTADDVGVIAAGTKYHIYIEFNKSEAKNKIRVNGGTLYEAACDADINRYSLAYVSLGRRTSTNTAELFLTGNLNQWFWFWDELTSVQQEWMCNSGSSRSFSEL